MKLNITGKSSLSSFLEKLCWVFLLAGLTITVALPWILDYYGRIFRHGGWAQTMSESYLCYTLLPLWL